MRHRTIAELHHIHTSITATFNWCVEHMITLIYLLALTLSLSLRWTSSNSWTRWFISWIFSRNVFASFSAAFVAAMLNMLVDSSFIQFIKYTQRTLDGCYVWCFYHFQFYRHVKLRKSAGFLLLLLCWSFHLSLKKGSEKKANKQK